MNFSALIRNYKKAGVLCPRWSDRLRYLGWLYSQALGLSRDRTLQIRFAFGLPVGDVTLNVRCNRGSDAFIFSEVFEHRYYDFALPETPRTVLDLGANIGFTGIYFSRKYPDADVVCVEPMPENVSLLAQNLKANQISARVVAKAIAVEDGAVTMQRAEMDYGHKVSAMSFGKQMTGQTIEVGAISVPTLMRELGWARIGLLKIDVEGYEGILLRQKCGWLDSVDAICIECHEGFGEEDLCKVATQFGFLSPVHLEGTTLLTRNKESERATVG